MPKTPSFSSAFASTQENAENTLVLYCPEAERGRWRDALAQALPDRSIVVWPQTCPQAELAVGWMPSADFMAAHPQLRYFFNLGAGVDALLGLDLPPQLAIVRIEDGGMAAQMLEYVEYAIFRHVRQFDRYEKSASQGVWQPQPLSSWQDYPIGIMGLGALGGHVAGALAQRGLPVLGWSQSPKAIAGVASFVGEAQLDDFLARTRILVCMLPLTAQTMGILNHRSLAQLQPNAYLINVARGGHLDESALLDLLASGHLAGAMLDVTQQEPLPPEHPFWRHPQVCVTPHISAQTVTAQAAAQIAANLARVAGGQLPLGLVESRRGY